MKKKLTKEELLAKKKAKKKELKEIANISRRKLRKVTDIVAGDIVAMNYFDPKYKDILHKVDQSPLIIVLGTFKAKKTGNLILQGVNLHWINQSQRKKILNIIIDSFLKSEHRTTKSNRLRKQRFFQLTYDSIKSDSTLRNAILNKEHPALRNYIIKRISGMRRVPIKYFDYLFGKSFKSVGARWSSLAKGHIIKKYTRGY
jgi:hypothetical protein